MSTVYLNGSFVPANSAQISVFDRGFLFGEGVYEVIPVYAGKALRLDLHFLRLANSLAMIGIENPYSAQKWRQIMQQLIAANKAPQQSIYLHISRGGNLQRDHQVPQDYQPTVFMLSTPIEALADAKKPQNCNLIHACTLADMRWNFCNLKSTALLGGIMLKQQAIAKGYSDAVLMREGKVTESTTSNVFIVKDEQIITPPQSNLILPGVTRQIVLELAATKQIKTCEREIDKQQLMAADEVWTTSSTKAIVPVASINKQQIGNGKAGAMWQKLMLLYSDYVERVKEGKAI